MFEIFISNGYRLNKFCDNVFDTREAAESHIKSFPNIYGYFTRMKKIKVINTKNKNRSGFKNCIVHL